jgi:hypothetical protein
MNLSRVDLLNLSPSSNCVLRSCRRDVDGAGAAGVFFFEATFPTIVGTQPVVDSHRKVT